MAQTKDTSNRLIVTTALMLAALMNTLDSTIANVALPHIQGSIAASAEESTWVLTSYILATAVMTPLSGWLSQKIGRKRMLLLSIVGFTFASVLCGMATSVPEIVAFRLLQGVAGASLMPLSQTVMLDMYEPHLIPRVMSLWSAAVILGPIVGPTLGGWLTENFSWRWVFYINLPIGIIAGLALYAFMPKDEGGRERPFDFVGFGGLAAFVIGLQMFLDRGPQKDWFYSHEIWWELGIAIAGLWVFIVQSVTAEHPFFHRDLAKDANFITTTLVGLFVGALLFSTTALLPTFMQNLLGYSALDSGIASMPRGLGSFLSFLLVPGLMVRFGSRSVLTVGLTLCIGALWMMGQFDLSMTSKPIMVSGFIQGVGVGMLFAPLNSLAYVTLDPSHRTEGTIVSTMMRSLGSSSGISMAQAMVIRGSAAAHSSLAEHIDPTNPLIRSVLPPFMNPTTTPGLEVLNGEVTRQGAMIGYVNVFSWMALATVGLVPLIFMLRSGRPVAPSPGEAHAD